MDEQIRLGHDALGQFGVDEVDADIAGVDLAPLGHLGESAGEVDHGLAAVLGGDEEDLEVARVDAGEVTVGRGLEDFVGVRHGYSERRLVSAKVGARLLDDGLLDVRQVALEEALEGVSRRRIKVARNTHLSARTPSRRGSWRKRTRQQSQPPRQPVSPAQLHVCRPLPSSESR